MSAVGTAVAVVLLLGVAVFVVGTAVAFVVVGITHRRAARAARTYSTTRR